MDIKPTQFSHGGGCGCKIAPGVLSDLLARMPPGLLPADLLVGTATADDAEVYRLNDRQAVVATTDFFTPIVDDPYDFGRIAATNAPGRRRRELGFSPAQTADRSAGSPGTADHADGARRRS